MSDPDTKIGGASSRFPQTERTVLAALRSSDADERSRAAERLLASYWKPVYKYVRLKWRKSNEDAKDLVQEFFARALEKDFFARYEPERAAFRTFLRTLVDRFVSNETKASRRLKRSGGSGPDLDLESAEREIAVQIPDASVSMEEFFHREWIRNLFAGAVEELRLECESSGKTPQFAIFELYDLEDSEGQRVTYAALAEQFEIPVTMITNHLAAMRRRFRQIVLDRIRELTATEDEFRAEARAALGVEI